MSHLLHVLTPEQSAAYIRFLTPRLYPLFDEDHVFSLGVKVFWPLAWLELKHGQRVKHLAFRRDAQFGGLR